MPSREPGSFHAAINFMPYTARREHQKTPEDLIKTDMKLEGFDRNPLQLGGVLNIKVTISEVVSADTTASVVTADAPAWEVESMEYLFRISGKASLYKSRTGG